MASKAVEYAVKKTLPDNVGPWDDTLVKVAESASKETLTAFLILDIPGQLDTLAEILEHLVMDTPEDQSRTDRFVNIIRTVSQRVSYLTGDIDIDKSRLEERAVDFALASYDDPSDEIIEAIKAGVRAGIAG